MVGQNTWIPANKKCGSTLSPKNVELGIKTRPFTVGANAAGFVWCLVLIYVDKSPTSGWKQKARQRLNRFFQIDRDKTARAAGNRINFSPQTDATTFALPSVSILLLCPTYTIASTLAAVTDSVLMRRFRLFLLRRTADGMTVGYWKVWNWKQYLLHYFTTRRWAKW